MYFRFFVFFQAGIRQVIRNEAAEAVKYGDNFRRCHIAVCLFCLLGTTTCSRKLLFIFVCSLCVSFGFLWMSIFLALSFFTLLAPLAAFTCESWHYNMFPKKFFILLALRHVWRRVPFFTLLAPLAAFTCESWRPRPRSLVKAGAPARVHL